MPQETSEEVNIESLTCKNFLECQEPKKQSEILSGMSHLELPENAPEAMYEQSKI